MQFLLILSLFISVYSGEGRKRTEGERKVMAEKEMEAYAVRRKTDEKYMT